MLYLRIAAECEKNTIETPKNFTCRKQPLKWSYLPLTEVPFTLYVCRIELNISHIKKQNIMETAEKTAITVEAVVKAPVEKVWKYWNEPEHIKRWAFASDDWHAPYSENDLRKDGTFKTTMAAKDGSFSFDFGGVYTEVQTNKVIEYVMTDGRKVSILFNSNGNETKVTETFDPENTHPLDMQRAGWQAILDNFKKYTEEN